MDEKVLEFWGNLMLQAAKGKKQSDDLFRWMRAGFADGQSLYSIKNPFGFEETAALFRRMYGLDKTQDRSDDFQKATEKALGDFQKSLRDSLNLMGLVPKREYLDLVEKYEKLKARCADQEETIAHQKMLLEAGGTAQADLTARFQNMVQNQGDIFQKMVREFGNMLQPPESGSGNDINESMKGKKEKNDENRKPE